MDNDDLVSRVAALEQRVNHLETVTAAITELLQKVAVIDTKIDNIEGQIKSVSNRLSDIEKQPGDRWGTVVKTCLTVGLTAVVTYFVSRFIP